MSAESQPFQDAAPRHSFLVPTFDWDIRPLARELLAGIAALPRPGEAELLILVDGNPALRGPEDILAEADALGVAARVIRAPSNLGRSGARNALAQLARGQTIHFLDADGLPDSSDFVPAAVAAAERHPDAAVCGGRSGKRLGVIPADSQLFALHSQRREWLPAAMRAEDPPAFFISANFAVGRDVFLSTPFDERFRGWGWEDTEWGLRLMSLRALVHVDNAVTHMETVADERWLAKLDQSRDNYALLMRLHPEKVRTHRLFGLMQALRPVCGVPGVAPLLRRLALDTRLPVSLRLTVAKLRQAWLFAPLLRKA